MKFKLSFSIGNTSVMLSLFSMPTPKVPTIAIASRVSGTPYHVVFLDYDYIELDVLVDELRALQDTFKLSDFHIFKMDRKDAYHAICLDMLPLSEVRRIVASSSCDLAFKSVLQFNELRSWILRTYEKGKRKRPEFLGIVESKHNEHVQSAVHAKYLNLHYRTFIKLKKPYDSSDLYMTSYLTASRVEEVI